MRFLKGFLTLLFVSVAIIVVFFPVTVFVHEGMHFVTYTLEGITVTEFHVLDRASFENGQFGYVTILKESGFGSLFHETIATLIGYLFLALSLLFCLTRPLKSFTVHQLQLMGVKRNSATHPQ